MVFLAVLIALGEQMGFLGWICIALVFFYLVGKISGGKADKKKSSSQAQDSKKSSLPNPETSSYDKLLQAHKALLTERWEAMDAQKAGEDLGFEAWRWDPATDAQLSKLEELGAPKKVRKGLLKGHASDLIGLFCAADEFEVSQLKVLGAFQRNLSETAARENLRVLFLDPSNREKWENRPPYPHQKAFAKLYGIKIPAKASFKDADALIDAAISEQTPDGEDETNTPMQEALDAFDNLFSELSDSEVCHECYEIKKPSQKAIVEAILAIGIKAFEQGDAGTDEVVEQLLDANPDLERPFEC